MKTAAARKEEEGTRNKEEQWKQRKKKSGMGAIWIAERPGTKSTLHRKSVIYRRNSEKKERKEEGASPFSPDMTQILLAADTHDKYSDRKVRSIDRYAFDYCISLGDVSVETLLVLSKLCREQEAPLYALLGNNDDYGTFYKVPYAKDLFRTRRMVSHLSCIGMEGCYRPNEPGLLNLSDEESQIIMSFFPAVDILFAHDSGKVKDIRPDQFWLSFIGWQNYQMRKWGHCGLEGISNYLKEKNPIYFFHGHHHINLSYRCGETKCFGIHGFALFDFDNDRLTHIM